MKPKPLYNIHCHSKESSNKVIPFRSYHVDDEDLNTQGYFTIGIHPWFIKDSNEQFTILQRYIHHTNCLAIGEAGIDKLHGPPVQTQKNIFTKQAQLAEELSKPLIIHCVKAFTEIIKLKQELKPSVPWIIHGYNKKLELARLLIGQGFYLSLGLNWLKKQDDFTELLKDLPGDKIFFESDDKPEDEILKLYNIAKQVDNFSAIIAKNVNLVFKV